MSKVKKERRLFTHPHYRFLIKYFVGLDEDGFSKFVEAWAPALDIVGKDFVRTESGEEIFWFRIKEYAIDRQDLWLKNPTYSKKKSLEYLSRKGEEG